MVGTVLLVFAISIETLAQPVSLELIKQWVTDNQASSVEEFLTKLPDSYRDHFVLMFDSRSLHRGTPTHPRLIFYGPDARLLTAVSTFPSDPRYHSVELIEFNAKSRAFEFAHLDFKAGEKPALTLSPPLCMNCHQQDPKPNWEPYDVWPGAFGAFHDTVSPNTQEYAGFSQFLSSRPQHPRLRSIPDTFPMVQSSAFGPPTYYTVSKHVGINSTLSILLGFLNRERIARQILDSRNHDQYRFAILAALLDCEEPIEMFLSPTSLSQHPVSSDRIFYDTQHTVYVDHKARVLDVIASSGHPRPDLLRKVDRFGLRRSEIRRIARLKYLLQARTEPALSVDSWSLALNSRGLAFNDGASGLENLVGHYAYQAFMDRPELLAQLPVRETPFHIVHGEEGATRPLMLYSVTAEKEAFCKKLSVIKNLSVKKWLAGNRF